MDYIKEYKSFINSHYLSEGIRITAGIVLPALLLSYFDLLSVGVIVSLGALSVSIADTPGPIHHRKNGMFACLIINTCMSFFTAFVATNPLMLGILLLVSCFTFSMLGVYGSRANSVGVSALLVMILTINRQHQGWDIFLNTLYILAGAIWYMLLSLLLYSFRPYKLVQQALGDCIMATADYLRARASFYEKEVDYDKTYQRMLEQQVVVHENQNLVRELLFKSRNITRESTTTSRTLLMLFTDIVDLFERAMTSYQDYKALHDAFNDSEILEHYRQLIISLADELDEIGIAVKSGNASAESGELSKQLNNTRDYFNMFRDEKRTAENIDGFLSLRQILNSIEDIAARIHTLHLYTTYDKELVGKSKTPADYDKFISHQPIDFKIFKDNLTLASNTFRHAIRISIATLVGYVISLLFPLGHSYWILLTIIVILKPAYSLTRKRNYERLIGTLLGALAGMLILYFIKDNHVLFVIMLVLMIGTYSLLRTHYMISVIFMTPYILLLFHILNKSNFETVITDRIIDTLIGSAIAFIANLLLLPAWEQEQIGNYMRQVIESNSKYFNDIAVAFIGEPVTLTSYKVSRKNAFVALANLSDAFNRMLSEPKSKRKNIKIIHQFVVQNHMLTSHIAALSYYVKPLAEKYTSADFLPVIDTTVSTLEEAAQTLQQHELVQLTEIPAENKVQQKLDALMKKRKEELQNGIIESNIKKALSEYKSIADQFNFIINIAADIKKTTALLVKE